MKRVCFLLFLLPIFGLAQEPHAILASLNAYKQTNGILLRWVIKGGSQCNGTKVFRRSGEEDFELINHIPGICGSSTENETYQFFDSIPLPNEYNHYKLELGFQGFSDTITVFYENFGNTDHQVFADHEANTYRILFSNDLNRDARLQLFDAMGREVYTETATDSDFSIQPTALKAGVYIYRITGVSEKDIEGKFYLRGR